MKVGITGHRNQRLGLPENETYGDFCKRVALTCPGCDENLPSYYDTWE